jgi:hypothetical protein
MITATYNIRFDFMLDAARLNIILEADVQEHHSDIFYKVTNIRIPGHAGQASQAHHAGQTGHTHSAGHTSAPILPEIAIRKHHGLWVHTDSGKATDLSIAIGKAIDAKNGGLHV